MRATMSVLFLLCTAGLTDGLPTPPPAGTPTAPPGKPAEPATEQEMARQRYEQLRVEDALWELKVAHIARLAADWEAKSARLDWENEKLDQNFNYAAFRTFAIEVNRSLNQRVRHVTGLRLPAPADRLPRLAWPREPDAPQVIQNAWRSLDNGALLRIMVGVRWELGLAYYELTGQWIQMPRWLNDVQTQVKTEE